MERLRVQVSLQRALARGLPALAVVCLVLTALPVPAQDADGDLVEDVDEAALAQAYAPMLYFHPAETYFPVSVEYALNRSRLERHQTNATPIVVVASPTATQLAAYNVPADPAVNPDDVYYLNNTGGGVHNESGILSSYRASSDPDTVYVHVLPDANRTVVQYWFYYAFNPGTWNNHEGDWEMIEVVLSGNASSAQPLEVGYSQHESGERMPWQDVDKEGTHPKVYVARGSHASYLKSHEGRIGVAGDQVSDGGPIWRPGGYALVNVGELNSPSPGNEWLAFAGRWGEFSLTSESRGEAGPPGPAYRQSGRLFAEPAQWAAGLDVPDPYLLWANWLLANFLLLLIAFVAGGIAFVVVRARRIRKKTGLGLKLWPFAHLRPMSRTTVALLVSVAGLAVGLMGFLMPWYVMTVDANAPGFLVTDGPEPILSMDGLNGLTMNPMRPDGRVVQVSVLPVPLGLILVITTALFFVRTIGTKTSRRLGGRFIAKGVVNLLPFIFVLLTMSLLIPALPMSDPSQLGVDDFVRPMAASPFGGQTTQTLASGETATLTWGVGLGMWLMLISSILMFVAAFFAISRPYDFLTGVAAPPAVSAPSASADPFASLPSPDPSSAADPFSSPPPDPSSSYSDPSSDPFSSPPPDPFPSMGSSSSSSGTCANCGTPYDAGATSCVMCGDPIS